MALYTSDSKTVVETKSYIGDFRDVLVAGETITSQAVTVTVFSGDDTNPAHLLFQGITVHPGWIEQRIRLGIPGNIYSINFVIGTSLGNTYDKVTRLAVLPEDGNAIPQFTVLYYTSRLYPYEYVEKFQSAVLPYAAHLLLNPYWKEYIKTNLDPIVGTMDIGAIYYNNYPPEIIQSTIIPYGGSLVSVSAIPYSIPAEGIKNNIAAISGTLVKGQVFYVNYASELIKSAIAPQGGTLV